MMPLKKPLLLTCVLTFSSIFSFAQEVELYSNDGSLTVRGELVDFSNQNYTIDTSVGRITFDTNTVLCRGDACPVLSPAISESSGPDSESGTTVSDFSIVGVGTQASAIVQELLPAYAQSLDAQINKAPDGAYVLTNSTEDEIANISLVDTASSSNLPALLQQQAAIALTAQPFLSDEVSDSDDNQVIGLNALTIVTAEDNPVSAISTSDVAKVFSGEIRNWSELGGPDGPIILYGPQSDSELARLFENWLISTQNDENTQLFENIVKVENVAEQVASKPDAIGYTDFSNSQAAKTMDIQGDCGIATSASRFTIKAEEYPLTQRFYAHQSAQSKIEHLDELLNFIQSDAGQDIVSRHSLINQLDTSISIDNQGERFVNAIASSATDTESELLRQMVKQIMDSERLSTTFRFNTGSDQMDQRAQWDVIRLAEKLQSLANRNSVVYLLGFTDSIGDFELNREVSLRRANQIRDALLETNAGLADQLSIESAGFGEIAPLACNENAQGRSINRRVEVWISNGLTTSTQ